MSFCFVSDNHLNWYCDISRKSCVISKSGVSTHFVCGEYKNFTTAFLYSPQTEIVFTTRIDLKKTLELSWDITVVAFSWVVITHIISTSNFFSKHLLQHTMSSGKNECIRNQCTTTKCRLAICKSSLNGHVPRKLIDSCQLTVYYSCINIKQISYAVRLRSYNCSDE